ncbi:MAG TPA: Trk system potassium transporter TrkA [Treponemataceae bacterium]|nr:Trk system potassium transporter TrkA [Treponemataceae bacterium]
MRVVIVGAGMVGLSIARALIEEKRDVVLIEKNAETARRVDNELDCLVINDDGSRPEALRLANTESADWFLALTGSDAVNIVSCGLVASESGKTRTIARVETPFYSALSPVQQKSFGIDYLIHPAMEAARVLADILHEGFAGSVTPLHGGALQLRTIFAPVFPEYVGKTLGELRQSALKHFLIAAVVRSDGIVVPKGDCRIEETDKLYVLGTPDSLNDLLGPVEGLENTARKIMIVGITRIGERLLELLQHPDNTREGGLIQKLFRKKPDIAILDARGEECTRLAHIHEGITIQNVDCLDEGVLEKVGVARQDLFVAAGTSQAENILIAQLAKSLGAKKSVAITTNHRFLHLGTRMDVDSYICSNDAVVSAVLETVRKAHIRTIYDFYEDDVEIVDLTISPSSPVTGKALRNLELPREVLLAFVMKDGALVVPTGDTLLEGGDEIGLVTHKKHIAALEHIFGGTDGS